LTRARFRVRGRVQGVGFRWFVVDEARRLGLTGWVRNLPDGGVEAEAQGDVKAVAELAAALGRGPAAARVDEVRREDLAPRQDAEAFEVRA